jgi:hypothetical protein
VALHKPAPSAAPVADGSPSSTATVAAAAAAPPVTSPLAAATATLPAPPNASALTPPAESMLGGSSTSSDTERPSHRKALHVTPFGNGPVGHANILHLKMDGPIEKIEGATTPTGFTVVIPDRRSLEAAGPLAGRDSRIAGIRVTNEGSGAELALNFRDGVPNYQVRARGDTLEIALAPQGKLPPLDAPAKPTSPHHKAIQPGH